MDEGTKRIRGRALQRIRERIIKRDPICVRCLKKDTPVYRLTTQVDHIVPLIKGGQEVDSNRQGLCDECHDIKTAEDFGYKKKQRRRIGPDGFPLPE